MKPDFPTSKIELHQWANSLLLAIVGFFVVQTYRTISTDHERIAEHETRITVSESNMTTMRNNLSQLTGRVEVISDNRYKIGE